MNLFVLFFGTDPYPSLTVKNFIEFVSEQNSTQLFWKDYVLLNSLIPPLSTQTYAFWREEGWGSEA